MARLSAEDESELLRRYRGGDAGACAALIEACRGIVRSVASGYHGGCVDREDLAAEATAALVRRLPEFDPDQHRDARWTTYAWVVVRSAARDAYRRQVSRDMPRLPADEELLAREDTDRPRRVLAANMVARLVLTLPPRLRRFVRLVHGLGGEPPCTLAEAGRKLNVCRKTATRWHALALRLMREASGLLAREDVTEEAAA